MFSFSNIIQLTFSGVSLLNDSVSVGFAHGFFGCCLSLDRFNFCDLFSSAPSFVRSTRCVLDFFFFFLTVAAFELFNT